ncbi:MAG: hypothetical protein HJJLKODD_02699 [Phycisphaerae bacterium]|nr:hypothetical protein [Phycisphaerae bacterium]
MTRLSIRWLPRWLNRTSSSTDTLQFNLAELSGSLGDLGTLLPLAVAMALSCGMNIGAVFVFAGFMTILSGIWFRQPIPIQPMKVVAAVAIAEGLQPGAIAAAGLSIGGVVLLLAWMGGIDWLAGHIPLVVVRGLQASLGIKLVWKGLEWLGALPIIGPDSWLMAGILGVVIGWFWGRRVPILLFLFLGGVVLMMVECGWPSTSVMRQSPVIKWSWPSGTDWQVGVLQGAIPQLPLTLLNSVIAVCGLSRDYFPGRGVAPRKMAATVGLMNLLCVPWGAMPMCHGAGGLAATHRFGARSGGSMVMLGTIMIISGILLGGVWLSLWAQYPLVLLAVMIIAAGITLTGVTRDAWTGRSLWVVSMMVGVTLLFSTLWGFVVGIVVILLLQGWDRRRGVRS